MEEKLNSIISKIKSEAEEEANKIIREAEEEAKKIIDNAKREAELLRERILARGRDSAKAEKQRILASAKLSAKRKIEETKEGIIKEVFDKALEKIKNVEADNYKNTLKRLIKSSVEVLGSKDVRIKVRKEDRGLVEDIIKELDIKAEISEELDSMGVVVESPDESLIIDNRFERILERKMDELRIKVAKELFG